MTSTTQTTARTVYQQLSDYQAEAEAAIAARLSEEELDYEQAVVLTDFLRHAAPERNLVRQQLANRNYGDASDTEASWVAYWRQRVTILVDEAVADALTRRAQAKAVGQVAIKAFREMRWKDAQRIAQHAAVGARVREQEAPQLVPGATGRLVRTIPGPDLDTDLGAQSDEWH
jgi:hypothetical protein